MTIIRLLTDGGMLFDAIHRYAPISERVIFANLSISPWYVVTETKKKPNKKILAKKIIRGGERKDENSGKKKCFVSSHLKTT